MRLSAILDALGNAIEPFSAVPCISWLVAALLVASTILLIVLTISIWRSIRNWRLAKAATFENFEVSESPDDYIYVHADDVASDMKTNTDATIAVLSKDGGIRRAKGTLARTRKALASRQIRIPRRLLPTLFGVADEQDISNPQKLRISKTERFPLERIWNHPDPNTRLQIRLGIWLSVVSIVVGTTLQVVSTHFGSARDRIPKTIGDCRAPLPEIGQTFTGPVTYVGDADGICVGNGDEHIRIRLADFYGKELNEKGGFAAKMRLRDHVNGKAVICRVVGRQGYYRVNAVCTLNGRTLGDFLKQLGVKEGGRGYTPPQQN